MAQTQITNKISAPYLKMEWILWGVALALMILAYSPVIPGLLHDYDVDQNAQHGILAVPVALWLLWRGREAVKGIEGKSSSWGLGVLILGGLFFLLGHVGHVAVVARASIVFLIFGFVIYTLGWDLTRKIWFPLFFISFLVPVPDSIISRIAFPLQLFASMVSTSLLRLVGITTVRDGNVLSIFTPAMAENPMVFPLKLEVVAACSGIRSITAYTMLSVLFAYLNRNRWFVALLLIALAIPIALIANILRVTSSGIMAYHFGIETAEGFLHDTSGMVLFLLGFVVFFLLSGLFSRLFPAPQKTVEAGKEKIPFQAVPRRNPVLVSLVLMGALAGLVSASGLRPRVAIVETNLEQTSFSIGDWSGKQTRFPEEDRINEILQVDVTFLRHYEKNGQMVGLYVGYYGTERGGRSSHYPESCYVGGGWTILKTGIVRIQPPDRSEPVSVNHLLVQYGERQQQVLHWYQVRKTDVIPTGLGLNLTRFWRSIIENRNDGTFVRVTSDVLPEDQSVEEALNRAIEFSELVIPELANHWPVERAVTGN